MIPHLVDIKSSWKVLPPGIHDATLKEIEICYATNSTRKHIFEGLKRGIKSLLKAGCKTIFIDGSFVSEKPIPGDFDACWDPRGVNHNKLDPVLLDFNDGRKSQKQKYYGEFFPASFIADAKTKALFLNYFMVDKQTGKDKGIIRLLLN